MKSELANKGDVSAIAIAGGEFSTSGAIGQIGRKFGPSKPRWAFALDLARRAESFQDQSFAWNFDMRQRQANGVFRT